MTMNKAEREALKALWLRDTKPCTYMRLRRQAYYSFVMECWMVPWAGMMVGIERDGYTHS